jgi:plastocyanin
VRRAPLWLLAIVACAVLAADAWGVTTRTIKIGDNYFVRDGSAPTVTVKRDTRVTWRWAGNSPHNVTVRTGPVRFHSTTKTTGTYVKRLTRRGTYKIYCSIHGAADQSMTLVVK